MIRLLPLLLLAACASAPAPVSTPADPLVEQFPELDQPMPWDPGVRKGVLPNGLTWYVEPNAEPQERVQLWMAVRAGSVQEDDDQQGLAHYVEHMAFNGTEAFPKNELIEYLESVGTKFGAHLNAHTSFEETVYKLQVPTDDAEILDQGFLVLREWAGRMSFDSEEMEKERGVVMEEWRRSRGAGGRARDALIDLVYHGSRHALRRPIGTEESLEAFELDAARRFYRDWYRPDLMAVYVVGDIEPDAMQARIAEVFGDLESPPDAPPRVQYQIGEHEQTLYGAHADPEQRYSVVSVMTKTVEREVQSPRGYREAYIGRAVWHVLNERLGDLAKKPDAPFLMASTGAGRMNPTTTNQRAYAVVKDGGTDAGLETLLVEIRRMRQFGVTEPELNRAKAELIRGMEKAWKEKDKQPSREVLQELLRNFTNGETVPGIAWEWDAVQRYVPALTVDQVNAFAADILPARSRVITATVPVKDGVVPPSEESLAAVVARVDAYALSAPQVEEEVGPLLPELPEPGSVTSKEHDADLDVHTWTLSNGARVHIKVTDFKEDEIRFVGTTFGGHGGVSDAEFVAASTATDVASRSGLADFDASQLARWKAGRNASAGVFINGTGQGVSGSASPEDLEVALQLAWARVMKPRLTEDGFQVAAQSRREWVLNRDADPSTPFADAYTRLLYGGHFRTLPWTVERLEQMDLETSRRVYREALSHWGDAEFVFVGNVDLATLEPLVARYLASLPAGEPVAFTDTMQRLAEGTQAETVVKGLEPKARVKIRFSGDFDSAPDTRHQLRMLGKYMSTRLREVLREDLGGTYSVGARVSDRFHPHQDYGIEIDFQCDPERVDELTAAALGVVDEVLAAPPDAQYPTAIAEQERRSLEESLRSNGFWLGALRGNGQRGEPRSALRHYWSLDSKITPEYLHAAAKAYIDLERRVTVTLLPEGPAEEPAGKGE